MPKMKFYKYTRRPTSSTSSGGSTGAAANRHQYRIGFADLNLDSLWDPEAEKYRVLCRMVHVTKATLHIGYIQMAISFIFSLFFAYHYLMAISGQYPIDHWINQYNPRYISQLLLAVSLQLILVVVMIHGVRTERRSLLLPYIIYASVAILAGCAQLGADIVHMDANEKQALVAAANGGGNTNGGGGGGHSYGNTQFASHLVGTMIHAWCLSVVWRCYTFLGEKKVARQIGEQLSATQAAFRYPEPHHLLLHAGGGAIGGFGAGGFGGFMFPPPQQSPPPYSDTVISGGGGGGGVPTTRSAPPSRPFVVVDAAPLLVQENNVGDVDHHYSPPEQLRESPPPPITPSPTQIKHEAEEKEEPKKQEE
jgi:hypothetical protein